MKPRIFANAERFISFMERLTPREAIDHLKLYERIPIFFDKSKPVFNVCYRIICKDSCLGYMTVFGGDQYVINHCQNTPSSASTADQSSV